ncbi:MAG TPA: polyprenyl synthetase family protein [Actinocrinis sp.]|uniref:polyprenyl synthetase family protein n=1 Tax=Actinocrinis sp. TaxID=1920516 RepID=UPI002DDD287A|nr:polyprenyl synthetase family protein [Actinocrinis sp.]HEV2346137.1 polyprenyl synthetase family protein [Actinocrinis sp.]
MGAQAPHVLAAMKGLVDPALRGYVDGLHPKMREISRFHFGWDDGAGSGKAVRPALAVLGARAVGASGDEPAVVDAACAVEFIHNFSLLHDDIMDKDRTRRHRPTAWTVYGTDQALLAGCALHTLAFELLARHGAAAALDALARSVQVLIAGQSDDLYLADRQDVTLDQCLEMEAGKTASLLSASASLGAIAWYGDALGQDARAKTDLLAEYGHHLGMAFQMVDDLLGIWGEQDRTGKPVAADLRARKRSAPVVAALASGTREGERLGALLAAPGELSEEDVALAAKLVEESGGRAWARERADVHTSEALARLDRLAPDAAAFGDLTEVTRFLLSREW